MAGSLGLNPQIADWIDEWFVVQKSTRGISEHTETAYRADLVEFFKMVSVYRGDGLTPRDLPDLATRDIRAFLADQKSSGNGVATRNRKLSAVKGFFRYLKTEKNVANEAILMAKSARHPERLPRPLDVDRAREAIDTVGTLDARPWINARNTAVVTLMYSVGLRVSEALGLVGVDLPLREQLRIKGKGNKVRQLPVLPVAREAVENYVSLCPFEMQADQPIFRGVRGGAMSSRQVALVMEQLRAVLGLPPTATPHAMRHSFASHLLAAGGDIRAIQELLGHSSLNATQIYTKVDTTQLLDAYRKARPEGKS